jgi:RNA polymerase sigma factor (sigma-70 family)
MALAPERGRADAPNVGHATQELYGRYGRQIYAYCLQQLHSREEAEDAVQTTFLNAFRGLQGGTVAQCEQAWIYKIAHNVCSARRVSTGRRLRLESPSDFEVLQETIASPTRTGDVELIGLEEALEGMPENQRHAILLREWQGLSYREIAEELGLSQASVEMLIFRARRALAHALEEPAARKTQRASRGLSIGGALAAIKSLFGGGTAVKAVAVAVTATATALGGAVQHTVATQHAAHHPATAPPASAPAGTIRAAAATAPAPSAPADAAVAAAARPLPHARASSHGGAPAPSGAVGNVADDSAAPAEPVTPVSSSQPASDAPAAASEPPAAAASSGQTTTAAAAAPAPQLAPPPPPPTRDAPA